MKKKSLLPYLAAFALVTVLLLTSCGTEKLIELANEPIRVSSNPVLITAFEHPTRELRDIIDRVNSIPDDRKAALHDGDIDYSATLHLEIERENGDLTMITVSVIDGESGRFSKLEHHTSTNTQDGSVEFLFTDEGLISMINEFIASYFKQ